MRYRALIIAGIVGMSVVAWLYGLFTPRGEVSGSFYDFTIPALDGNPINFEHFRGKNILIVNTASKCGYTPQYAELQKLHETYGDHVTVLGFPANNFLWQEPGTNEDIAAFCSRNYGVTFQMFQKISVIGRDQHPLYTWLSSKAGKTPKWNFCKYLIDGNGQLVGFWDSRVSPLDESIIKHITP